MTLQYVAVVVTEQDIQHGRLCDCEECPIALAIRRIIKPQNFNSVQIQNLFLYNRDEHSIERIKLPFVAREFIYSFDIQRAGHVKELHFEMLISDRYLMLPIINNMVGV